jgi:hypothetical protein
MIKKFDTARVLMRTLHNTHYKRLTVYYNDQRHYVSWDEVSTNTDYYIDDVLLDTDHTGNFVYIAAAVKIVKKNPIGFSWNTKNELLVLFSA